MTLSIIEYNSHQCYCSYLALSLQLLLRSLLLRISTILTSCPAESWELGAGSCKLEAGSDRSCLPHSAIFFFVALRGAHQSLTFTSYHQSLSSSSLPPPRPPASPPPPWTPGRRAGAARVKVPSRSWPTSLTGRVCKR